MSEQGFVQMSILFKQILSRDLSRLLSDTVFIFFDITLFLFSGTADCQGMSSVLHKGASNRQKLKQNLLRGGILVKTD